MLTQVGSVPPAGQGTPLAATKPFKPHRCKAGSLGWVQPDDQQLVVNTPNADRVRLHVRVLGVGE